MQLLGNDGPGKAAAAGRTDFDATDRMAIVNLIHAYSIEVDRFNLDAWFDLFTDDAVFVGRVPGLPPVEQSGEEFHRFFRQRFGEFKAANNQRRHLISNIIFVEQEEDSAHTIMSGLLTSARDGKTFHPLSSLNYEGWYVKSHGVWQIKRWFDAPDVNPDAR